MSKDGEQGMKKMNGVKKSSYASNNNGVGKSSKDTPKKTHKKSKGKKNAVSSAVATIHTKTSPKSKSITTKLKDINSKSGSTTPNTMNSEKKYQNIADVMFGRVAHKALDVDTEILETQKRIWTALKEGYNYSDTMGESDLFLRRLVQSKMNMMVLYVDLVGSTKMVLEMPIEKIVTIINSFAHEMTVVMDHYNVHVLKFVGDAVIGYYVANVDSLQSADNIVGCAKSMLSVIRNGINPILGQYDYPDLSIKIGIDYGQSIVVRYGSDQKQSHIDLLGPVMNMAAKIQAMASPNHILVGSDVYEKLHPSLKNEFVLTHKNNDWKYRSKVTGEIYKVYELTGPT